ncbi:MAG: DEAD/DEAH box helicase [Ignavibacteria bacterium]|nr:DEAD/DEAH box helicase [Ignavibacteria bacterium]
MNLNETFKIKEQLFYSWNPFFSSFGKLTPIQIKVIPKVLEGRSLVISAPTASGKTEAVVAPIAERIKKEKWKGLSVVYIVPTRALANDIYLRLEGPLLDMNIFLGIKHGDKLNISKKKNLNILITTPESFDSLICRQSYLFTNVRTIIIDEIHLLDNTYRGDQLRVLLKRISVLTRFKSMAVILLSATLSNPSGIAKRYVKDFEKVTVDGCREIEYYLFPSLEEALEFSKKKGFKKILAFCNKREQVENYSGIFRKFLFPYPVVTHHSGLSKASREEAEQVMREAIAAACISTSSLEVGIDIGSIDLIILCDLPWSITSLLQRIGRGNRKKNKVFCIGIYRTIHEKNLFAEMFEVAKLGLLPVEDYFPDFSVIVQQIFSLLFQIRSGLEVKKLTEYLSEIAPNFLIQLILSHLSYCDWLESKGELIYPSTKLLDFGEKGFIHSNIPDSKEYNVVDISTGKSIGSITGIFDEIFVLSGCIWKVVKVKEYEIRVIKYEGKAYAPYFKRHKKFGKFYQFLPVSLKKEMMNFLYSDFPFNALHFSNFNTLL